MYLDGLARVDSHLTSEIHLNIIMMTYPKTQQGIPDVKVQGPWGLHHIWMMILIIIQAIRFQSLKKMMI